MKVSFEILALEDAKIFSNIQSVDDAILAFDNYYLLLDTCGWTSEEYELELLHRIDKDWTSLLSEKLWHSN